MRPGRWRADKGQAVSPATGLERGGSGLRVGCAEAPRAIPRVCDLDRRRKLSYWREKARPGLLEAEPSSPATGHPAPGDSPASRLRAAL